MAVSKGGRGEGVAAITPMSPQHRHRNVPPEVQHAIWLTMTVTKREK